VVSEPPEPLRAAVRARRAEWRFRVAPGGCLGPLGPVACVLAMVLLGTISAAGFVLMPGVGVVAFVGLIAVFTGDLNFLLALGIALTLPPIFFAGMVMTFAGAGYAFSLGYHAVGYHQVHIRPDARLVVSGWVRRSMVDPTDLNRMLVRGNKKQMTLVLRAGARTVVCEVQPGAPLLRVDPTALTDWLHTVLAVPAHHYEPHTPLPPPNGTWPADTVAAIWDVPPENVPAVADRLGVHASGDMFNAYDVEVHAAQARTITGHPYARWDAYVHVPDPDALAAEFRDRGVTFDAPLTNTDDGLRGFELTDHDGYVLFFGRPARDAYSARSTGAIR
jgi:hypothetical protein